MFTIMFTLILAEWQEREVESLITYNYTCTWTLGPVSGIRIRFYRVFQGSIDNSPPSYLGTRWTDPETL